MKRLRILLFGLCTILIVAGCTAQTPSVDDNTSTGNDGRVDELEGELQAAQAALATAEAAAADTASTSDEGTASEASAALEAELADARATTQAAEAAVAEAIAAAEAAAATTAEGEPILVGVSKPLSGPVAISGINQINGFRLAIDEINAAGGVLGGRPLQLIVEDNKCVPAEGVSTYEKLHNQDRVSVTYGASCSSVTLAVMPLIERAEIPNVTAVSTNPDLTEQSGIGGNEWQFRINAPDSAFGSVAGDVYVETLGYQTFSALVTDDDFGRGAFEAFRADIEAAGGEILSVDYFQHGETDFLSVLTKIESLQPDSILAFINPDPTLVAGRQYQELGMTIPWSGRGQYFTEQMVEEIGCETIEGWASIDPWFPVDPNPDSQAFVQKINENFGIDAVWQHLTPYTAAYVIADAIERAGSDDPAAIREALETTSYESLIGLLEFDEYNQAHGNVYAAQMQEGCVLEVVFSGSF